MRSISGSESLFLRVNPGPKQKGARLEVQPNKELPQQIPSQQLEAICTNCQKWLRNQVKIVTESTIYCVGCFAAVLPPCEYYQVVKHEAFEIVGGGWPARDEIILFSAIEKMGFGNWQGIQEYMAYLGANYFTDQIQYHYDKFYGKDSQNFQHFRTNHDLRKISNGSRKNKNTSQYGGKYIENNTSLSFSRMMDQKEQQIPCYNAKRRQFNIEYKQNLQKYVADMEFRENDSQKEIQLKFKILEAYNLGLEDRIKKHNFILEHKLLDQNYQAEETRYLQLNPYANKAHQLLIELMRTMSLNDYLELRRSLQFCLKTQAIIDGLRAVRNSNVNSTIRGISKLGNLFNECPQMEGMPRKKVKLSPDNAYENEQKNILKKLNVTKQELMSIISQARDQNQTVIYKKIKITPLNNLAK